VSFLKGAIPVALVLAWAGRFVAEAPACDYGTVRDAAFTEPRDVHRLCVIANTNDEAGSEIHGQLAAWFEHNGAELNIELLRIAAADPDVPWEEYGLPSAPTPETPLPAVVLAGRWALERKGWVIDSWEPAPSIEELNVLKSSPARNAIANRLVRRLAVLLYIPGTDENAGAAERVLDSVAQRWLEKEPLGLSIVRVDRSDRRERLLLSFVGAGQTQSDWVAVVFGRGKFMSPPLEGEEITEVALDGLIETLRAECTCLRPPARLGVDIPMTWNASLDEIVVPLRSSEEDPDLIREDLVLNDMGNLGVRPRVMANTAWTLGSLVLIVSIATAAMAWRNHRGES